MGNEYYFYITSDDSKEQHPENKGSDFTVELTKSINLEGDWECSLKQVGFSSDIDTDILYICSDLCEESLACGSFYPVLRVVSNKTKKTWRSLTFNDPYYVRLRGQSIQRIRIFLRGVQLAPVTLDTLLTCTLHLRKST